MLLSFSFYWSIRLEKRVSHEVISLTVRTGLVIGFLAIGLSFLPGALWPNSLVLMSAMYVMLGLGQSALEERLFTNTIREYVAVLISVTLMYLVLLPWR
jgi:hypothetical protein